MAGLGSVSSVKPGDVDAEVAQRALRRIKDYLARHPDQPEMIEVVVEHDEPALVLPRATVTMFAQILAQLAEGRGVSVVPSQAELSTQQAADLLGVSRPYLIRLLEDGVIPHRKVGRHRRVSCADLMAYKQADDGERREVADELGGLGQELGF
ncbi:DNA binding domain-containing protein, excisionase family [Glycomyces sambucus]|uniref:DNA binding domain-containing protein, excisionase family n=1 Tax=Glycomyces sambucus TaxID=380244 RepID=A0A1G9GL20_9ACTN|nr:helix-turn-helix domain-containing protein [Glycomyces sambucus]SDL01369.1 DNA binding domain-containing protein, excisionase family [Glycomyces sambucus]